MQITLANFFKATKPKLVIFALLVGYCLGAIMMFKAPLGAGMYQTLSVAFFAPAVFLILAVARFFQIGPYEFEGKGPDTTPGEMALGFVIAAAFGLFILYCIACVFGMWYESVRHRVHTNAGKK